MQEGWRKAGARDRASLSCTECRRKKKKCSAETPCRRCLRTFPPVDCIYTPVAASGGRPPLAPPRQDGMHDSASIVNVAFTAYVQQESDVSSERRSSSSTAASSTGSSTDIPLRTIPSGSTVVRPNRSSDDWVVPFSNNSKNCYPELSPIHVTSAPKIAVDLEPDEVDNNDDNFDEIVRRSNDSTEYSNGGIVMGSDHSIIPPVIGFTMFDLLRHQSIAPTRNYARLLSLYDAEVVPAIITIDGSNFRDNLFTDSWIPTTVESPLLLRTNLHNAVLFRMSTLAGLQASSLVSKEQTMTQIQMDLQTSLTLRGEIIALLNKRLKASKLPPDDAIAAVVLFIWYEVVPGNWKEVFYHTRGLAAMIRLRGGLKASGIDGMLRKLIILQHLNVAIFTETRTIPILLDNYATQSPPLLLEPKPSHLASPLCSDLGTFTANRGIWGLSAESATILDSVAYLTMKIHGHITSQIPCKDIESEVIAAASQIRESIFSASARETINTTDSCLPHTKNTQTLYHNVSEESGNGFDPYFNTILATADLYTSAIASRRPFFKEYSKSALASLVAAITLDGVHKWAKAPGIWSWILCVLNAVVRAHMKRGWFSPRGQQGSAVLQIALQNWELGVKCLQTFVSVQEWLRASPGQEWPGDSLTPSIMDLIDLDEPDENEYAEMVKILTNLHGRTC